jgi:hypothetical protein
MTKPKILYNSYINLIFYQAFLTKNKNARNFKSHLRKMQENQIFSPAFLSKNKNARNFKSHLRKMQEN